jgi:hypothetical protein
MSEKKDTNISNNNEAPIKENDDEHPEIKKLRENGNCIDLSNNQDFKSIMAKCRNCKGIWPLLSTVNLCHMCIVSLLPPVLTNTAALIFPDKYMIKDTVTDECPICFETMKDKEKLIETRSCYHCLEMMHIDCWNKAYAVGNCCPICKQQN